MFDQTFGPSVDIDVTCFKGGAQECVRQPVATEVPCTLQVNGDELGTMLCTPADLKEFAVGYLFTSGLIQGIDEFRDFYCDERTWRLDITTTHRIDPALLGKRIYTSGCGRGVMYDNMINLAARHPLENSFSIEPERLVACMRWLLGCSQLHRDTHGVHTVAVSLNGDIPDVYFDDIGRHNAVDKALGHCLLQGVDLTWALLMGTGRISSEILQKVKRAGVPLLLSRGAPTHQTVLQARDMGITVVGFARGGNFTVYSHPERVSFGSVSV
ncbi:MAG: formate dehydrogenase accessory sulfurtransferase FdhD [Deltaproteobacteria bacterium]|nr:formate dehydrogenase accessory sulfurtransferase FdhD [Deltaproteobacteria bacterium]